MPAAQLSPGHALYLVTDEGGCDLKYGFTVAESAAAVRPLAFCTRPGQSSLLHVDRYSAACYAGPCQHAPPQACIPSAPGAAGQEGAACAGRGRRGPGRLQGCSARRRPCATDRLLALPRHEAGLLVPQPQGSHQAEVLWRAPSPPGVCMCGSICADTAGIMQGAACWGGGTGGGTPQHDARGSRQGHGHPASCSEAGGQQPALLRVCPGARAPAPSCVQLELCL